MPKTNNGRTVFYWLWLEEGRASCSKWRRRGKANASTGNLSLKSVERLAERLAN